MLRFQIILLFALGLATRANAEFHVGDSAIYASIFVGGYTDTQSIALTALRFNGQQWIFRYEKIRNGEVVDLRLISQDDFSLVEDYDSVGIITNCEMQTAGVRGSYTVSGVEYPSCTLSLGGEYPQDSYTITALPFSIVQWNFKEQREDGRVGIRMISFAPGQNNYGITHWFFSR